MNLDKCNGEFDNETCKWMAEIDSFRSPPPPRKLFGSDLLPSNDSSVLPSDDNCGMKKHENGNVVTKNSIVLSKPSSAAASLEKRHNHDSSEKWLKSKFVEQPKSLIASSLVVNKKPPAKNAMDEDEIGKLNEAVRRACRPTIADQTVSNPAESSSCITFPIVQNGNIFKTENLSYKPIMVHEERHACNLYDVPTTRNVAHQTVKDHLPQKSVPLQSFPMVTGSHSKNGSLDRVSTKTLIGQDALEAQQQKFLQFEAQVAQQLDKKEPSIGICSGCDSLIEDQATATQALGKLYHSKCFTCKSCGRSLTGQKFYEAQGNIYCEEDYFYIGYRDVTEKCAVCQHFIMDMIVQAVGQSFHPACFRCCRCKQRLDGVPFTLDDQGSVYCVADYHRLFAPLCARCTKPIVPTAGRDETVRVVAMQKDYHIDCYKCEGCGLQLTDDADRCCYPLDDHLLCYECHLRWRNLNLPPSDFLISDV